MNKRGISAVVAVVLTILITIAAVAILWIMLLPILKESVVFDVLEIQMAILTGEGYTVYDPVEHFAFVQVKRGVDDEEITALEIAFVIEGNSVKYRVDDPPGPNGVTTYLFNFMIDGVVGIPDTVSVAPIFKDRVGDVLSKVDMPVKSATVSVLDKEKSYENIRTDSEYVNVCEDLGRYYGPPRIWFESSTDSGTVLVDSIFVSVNASDICRGDDVISTFIDFDNSLIGWFKFENNINDESGINNEDTNMFRGDTSYKDGKFGNGIYFDGNNDTFLINSSNGMNSQEGTVSFWFNRERITSKPGLSSNFVFAHFTRGGGPFFNRLYVYFNETDNRLFTYMQEGGSYIDDAQLIEDFGSEFGIWHHITMTWKDEKYSVYLDGDEKVSDIYYNMSLLSFIDGSPINAYGAEMLHLGGWDATDVGLYPQGEFTGSIDDLLIFNRSLSGEEAIGIYAGTASDYLGVTFDGLTNGDYNFKAYVQDTVGNINTTERIVTISV